MGVFNQIQLKRPNRSKFDLSYDHKLSFKMGKLIPVNVMECVPGDKITVSTEAMFRMMPMIAPIMHKVEIFIHHFFVPNRLIWDDWEKFITGGVQDGTTMPVLPMMDYTSLDVQESTLADYLGLPLGDYTNMTAQPISALPFAAYQRIWQEYYASEDLEDIGEGKIKVISGFQSGPNTLNLATLRDRAWEHDYFTSALPYAQKGAAIELPIDLVGTIPVTYNGNPDPWVVMDPTTGLPYATTEHLSANFELEGSTTGTDLALNPMGTLEVDMNNAGTGTATTINDLRTAFSLQKWLEKNARAGTRYIESILAHFGVRSSDKRLDRPEYIGGSRASMSISEVLQTSETDANTPQGNMAGHGIGVTSGKNSSFFCEEHGYMMSILSIRPKTAYDQGIPKHFQKADRLDYFWPDFAFLGEQEIKNKELKVDFSATLPNPNDGLFGYIPRYSEYRYMASRVSGQMRTTLDFWHMSRQFSTLPTLSAEFVRCSPDKRIFAVTSPTDDEIIGHIFHRIRASRPIPFFGSPGGI